MGVIATVPSRVGAADGRTGATVGTGLSVLVSVGLVGAADVAATVGRSVECGCPCTHSDSHSATKRGTKLGARDDALTAQ